MKRDKKKTDLYKKDKITKESNNLTIWLVLPAENYVTGVVTDSHNHFSSNVNSDKALIHC